MGINSPCYPFLIKTGSQVFKFGCHTEQMLWIISWCKKRNFFILLPRFLHYLTQQKSTILIAFLQAYIFTLLSAVFIGLAVKEEGH
jgi:hypothetical protein